MTPWFSRVGEPVLESERERIAGYLHGLGLPEDLPIAGVADWTEAHRVVTHPRWDSRWWDAEQAERRKLLSKAATACGETEVPRLLSQTLRSIEQVRSAAVHAAVRGGCTDAGMIGAAVGAAGEAIHLGELARLAGETEEHAFAEKCALFAAGRWPLGIVNGAFHVF